MSALKLGTRAVVLRRMQCPVQPSNHSLHCSSTRPAAKLGSPDPRLVTSSTTNNVTTLTMNDPKKLNGWTGPMMLTLRDRFLEHAVNPETKVRSGHGTTQQNTILSANPTKRRFTLTRAQPPGAELELPLELCVRSVCYS